MKKALLFSFFVFSGVSFGQTVANTAPDLQLCDPTVMMGDEPYFDLTEQNAIILGDQDPSLFTVTYFEGDFVAVGWSDPETNTNPIEDPEAYYGGIAPNPETIFARVTNIEDNTYAITTFEVELITVESIIMTVDYCDGYHIPWFNIGHLYTEPGGAGILLEQDAVLTEPPGTLYFYAEYKGCIITGERDIMHNFYPFAGPLEPLAACDPELDGTAEFDLTQIVPLITVGEWSNEVTFHETYDDAVSNINQIENATAYPATSATESIYVRKTSASCESVTSMELVLIPCEGNSVTGNVSFNAGNNDCTEEAIPAAGIQISCINGDITLYTSTGLDGSYSFMNVIVGENIIQPVSTTYFPFMASPANYELDSSMASDGYNFCLSANGDANNVSVYIGVIGSSVPGFESAYYLLLDNDGAYPEEGTVTISFDDALLDFLSGAGIVANGNMLTYDYNLSGFETKSVGLTFMLMEPPVAESGDILVFTAHLVDQEDDVPEDDVSILEHVVVNSYDPNDIAVHEGEYISEEQAGDYLHYTVRFQNTGTAPAVNIKVQSLLDADLDWSTFQPIISSHNFQASRENNQVEFQFNDIYLVDSLSNEPASHGYFSYRIKPKVGFAIGDIVEAQAHIYFDFNPAIDTNIVSTQIEPPAGIEDVKTKAFIIYPNPADHFVSIELTHEVSGPFEIRLVDVLGKTVLSETVTESIKGFSVSNLERGIYFITVANGNNKTTRKLVIK